jgi:queuine tRNA-ribosyltransferase
LNFTLTNTDSQTKARAGVLVTDHGSIQTPCFMPVGTLATVKSVLPRDVWDTGARICLANAYHLYLRPGTQIVREAGGVHKFANWDGAILTDSGGYQVYSLGDLRKVTDDEVVFKSHLDGSKHIFTPEKVIEIERDLGPDIMMPLDECPPSNAERKIVEKAVKRTIDWAERAVTHFHATKPLHGYDQALFLIVQGGVHHDLRSHCAEALVKLDTFGYAIGGLAVGEPNEVMYEVTDHTTNFLPQNKPRYLMGVGTPIDLVECIARGVDMFDCVMPTRNARNGQLFTRDGRINIKNAKWKTDFSPIDAQTNSYASQNFTKAYLNHLFIANEMLGATLASIHNIAFYQELVREARERILDGSFADWKTQFVARYNGSVS